MKIRIVRRIASGEGVWDARLQVFVHDHAVAHIDAAADKNFRHRLYTDYGHHRLALDNAAIGKFYGLQGTASFERLDACRCDKPDAMSRGIVLEPTTFRDLSGLAEGRSPLFVLQWRYGLCCCPSGRQHSRTQDVLKRHNRRPCGF
jgi:hypothetical protein